MAGQGGLDADAMWAELKKADSSKVIDASHIPTSVLDGRWVKKAGDTMTGTLTSASTSGAIVFKGVENCDITNIYKDNGVIKNDDGGLTSIRNGLRFNWYDTYWYIGNLRGSSTDSAGFGVVDHNNKLVLRVTPNDVRAPRFMSTVATGLSPLIVSSNTTVDNLSADLLDGYHAFGTSNALIKYGYTVGGTKPAWCRIATYSIRNTETMTDVCFVLHSSFSDLFGLLVVKTRGTAVVEGLLIASYNINRLNIRIYHDAEKKNIELYCYGGSNYSIIQANLLYSHDRNGGANTNITLYRADTKAPSWSTYVNPGFVNLQNSSEAAKKLQTPRTLWGQSFDGTANVSGDMTGVGNITMSGALHIGDATSPNTIYFYGTTGDGPGSYSHTFIAERFWGGTESGELVLFKGNDLSPSDTDATTVGGAGPDRIRHIAAAHLFQTYASPISGSVESICTSSALRNLFSIAPGRVVSYIPLQSIVASGTAPFIVASNTVVGNLNADLLDGLHAERFLLSVGRSDGTFDLNTYSERAIKEIRTTEQTTNNAPFAGYGLLANLWDSNKFAALQIGGTSTDLFFRGKHDGTNKITSAWHRLLHTENYASIADGRYVKKAGDIMTGDLTMNNTKGFKIGWSTRVVKTSGVWIHGGGDTASSTDANLRFASWYGIGWYPTIDSTSGVRQGNNAMWLNVRTGVLDVHSNITSHNGYLAANWDSARRLVMGGGSSYAYIDSRNSSNNVLCNIVLEDNKVFIGNYAESSRFVSTVGTGTAPYQCSSTTLNTNLNADLLDGYHAFGTSNALIKYGYTVGGTKPAWCRIATYSIRNTETMTDVCFVLHSSFSDLFGLLVVKTRGTAVVEGLLIASYNINRLNIRIYHDAEKKNIELYCYGGSNYSIIQANLLYSHDRNGGANTNITLYRADTKAPSWSTYVNPGFVNLQNSSEAAKKLQTPRTLWGQSFDGTANVSGDMTGVGNITMSGALHIGDATSPNTIYFYGTTGDGPGSYSHTFIAERFWGGTESGELVLFKGNDLSPSDTDATTVGGAGPDRIRHIAAAHLFQTYASPISGSVESICTSSALRNLFSIAPGRVVSYIPLQSIVASGTAPFIVASNTVVGNLNADLLDGLHAERFLLSVGRSDGTFDLNTYSERAIKEIRTTEQTTNNAPFAGYGLLANLWDSNKFAALQIGGTSTDLFFRGKHDGTNKITSAWHRLLHTENYASIADGRYVKKAGDIMTGDLTMNNTKGFKIGWSTRVVKTSGVWIHGGGDTASSTDANLRFASWYGIGWYPTIDSTSGVRQGNNAMWLNVRTGVLDVHSNITSHNGYLAANWDSARRLVMGGGSSYAYIDSRNSSNNVLCNIVLEDNKVFIGNYAESSRFVSTVGTGTAPYQCSSTTLNTNLNADLLDGEHGAYYQNRMYDGFVSQYKRYDYIEFLRFVIPSGQGQLRAYVIFDLCRVETGGNMNGRAVLRIRRGTDNNAGYIFYVTNFGRSWLPELRCTTDDGITWRVWMKCVKDSYDPYIVIKIVEQYPYGYVTTQNTGTTGTPSGSKYTVVAGIAGLSNAANILVNTRNIFGQPFNGSGDVGGQMTSTSIFVQTGDATLKVYSGRITDARSDGNICLQTSINATDGQSHSYPTQYQSRCNLSLQPRGGQVYIGQNPDGGDTGYKLTVNGSIKSNGNIIATGAITAKASSSDIRLKTDIQGYDAMGIIRKFRSVKYHWNNLAKRNSEVFNHDNWNYGLIAQDLLSGGYSQWVKDAFNDYYTIDYERLIPVVWKGLQEVDDEVTRLKKRVRELENRLGINNGIKEQMDT